jgi:hypothetical protein
MGAFASGGRRRSEIAGLRREQLSEEPPIEVPNGPPLASLAIHLGRTKTSGADHYEVVYLTGRPVVALNSWLAAAKIDSGSVFRGMGGKLPHLQPGHFHPLLDDIIDRLRIERPPGNIAQRSMGCGRAT